MTATTDFHPSNNPQVLIVGAGPSGMVLALWLTKQGTTVRIIDKNASTGTQSRAMAVQARTLELYQQMGIAEQVIADGFRNMGMNFWSQGKRQAHILMGELTITETPYPFILTYPQDKHEKLLEQTLAKHGVTVERNTELLDFVDNGNSVTATIRHADGQTEAVTTPFLAGCDGARSVVRKILNADFDGGTYKQLFYVADAKLDNRAFNGEVHIAFDNADLLLVMPYDDAGNVRLIGTIEPEKINKTADTLTFDDVNHRNLDALNLQITQINWFSTYHVHHRVTKNFRHGQVFLLGDAAHIHSPAGGQGMNTGIADAINLAWKLTAVLNNKAPNTLLDSIDSERAAFAHTLVNTTDKVFDFATKEGQFANFMRSHIAPQVIKMVWHFDMAKEKIFETISQIKVNYRDSKISEGIAGDVHGGDRLPYVKIGDTDNFAEFDGVHWQMQVYGKLSVELQAWCDNHNLKLVKFDWQEGFKHAGFAKNSVFLLRPDSYVAVAVVTNAVNVLDAYVSGRKLGLSCDKSIGDKKGL